MKKSVCTFASVSLLTSMFSLSSADSPISLTLDNPYQTVQAGVQTQVFFSGKVSVLSGYDVSSFAIEQPSTDGWFNFISDFKFDPKFESYYLANRPSQGYEGNIFSITVPASAAPGDYFVNMLGWGESKTLCELGLYAKNGDSTGEAWQAYGITVRETGEPSVPGPAAVLPMALGLAGAGLRRRRRS